MLTGMNVKEFEDIGYYFEQSLKLIVFAYEQIKRDKFQKPYSRRSIHNTTLKERKSSKSHNEIEDHLRADMVRGYLKKSRRLFNLGDFSIQSGVEEFKKNVKTGIVDIKFELISANTWDGTYFIFECKRLNKYSNSLKSYIEEGMMRFIGKRYYPETSMNLAGMIAFVEVNLEIKPDGYLVIEQVAKLLQQKIIEYQDALKTQIHLHPYRLTDKKYLEISNFKYSYLSKHIRSEDNREISIHHLLLDYYDILVS
jgi:hypothetical protein